MWHKAKQNTKRKQEAKLDMFDGPKPVSPNPSAAFKLDSSMPPPVAKPISPPISTQSYQPPASSPQIVFLNPMTGTMHHNAVQQDTYSPEPYPHDPYQQQYSGAQYANYPAEAYDANDARYYDPNLYQQQGYADPSQAYAEHQYPQGTEKQYPHQGYTHPYTQE
jgi:hypothetical protein